MASRNYERLPIEEFGRRTILAGDLDPVYIALQKVDDLEQQMRWLVAYWCFYDCGVASWLSERTGRDFWAAMGVAAANQEPAPTGDRWPRAKERRHFRGVAAIDATRKMAGMYLHRPEEMVERLLPRGLEGTYKYEEIADRAQEMPLFGPWIGFKVADMVDRVLGTKVDFEEAHVFMFKDPAQAAEMLWRQHHGYGPEVKVKDKGEMIHQVVQYLTAAFADLMAPPFADRPVGLQEVETVLCKWKSHTRGHYPLLNDLFEIREGVEPWTAHSETARVFLDGMPSAV